MKPEFIKMMMVKRLEKSLTVKFPQLRRDNLSEREIEEFKKELNRDGLIDALKETGQDTEELKVILKDSLKEVVSLLAERAEKILETMFEEIKKETAK